MNIRTCVRIMRITIRNIKNVEEGSAKFPNFGSINRRAVATRPDITGIYGQNGSGKTALVEAIDMLRHVICGNAVPYEEYAGLLPDDRFSEIEADFFIEHGEKKYKVTYDLQLKVSREQTAIEIAKETLTYWQRGSAWKAQRDLSFENPFSDEPMNLLQEEKITISIQTSRPEKIEATPFSRSIANLALLCAQKHISIFFNPTIRKALSYSTGDKEFIYMQDVIMALYQFAYVDLNVIGSAQLGTIHNSRVIPVHTHSEEDGIISRGVIHLDFYGVTSIPKENYPQVLDTIQSINTALEAIVPKLRIELVKKAELSLPDNTQQIQVETFAIRDGRRFQLCYESEGIKRIISILNYLIAVYNQSGICLVIDELDSGIFEYLLGEILGMMRQGIKGQLIFTSHNLRIMEKLDTFSILCTTVNPKDRYIQLLGIEKNHNHRDFYIRALTVGGQKEDLYDEDDLTAMGFAFRKAGYPKELPVIRFSQEFMGRINSDSSEGDDNSAF